MSMSFTASLPASTVSASPSPNAGTPDGDAAQTAAFGAVLEASVAAQNGDPGTGEIVPGSPADAETVPETPTHPLPSAPLTAWGSWGSAVVEADAALGTEVSHGIGDALLPDAAAEEGTSAGTDVIGVVGAIGTEAGMDSAPVESVLPVPELQPPVTATAPAGSGLAVPADGTGTPAAAPTDPDAPVGRALANPPVDGGTPPQLGAPAAAGVPAAAGAPAVPVARAVPVAPATGPLDQASPASVAAAPEISLLTDSPRPPAGVQSGAPAVSGIQPIVRPAVVASGLVPTQMGPTSAGAATAPATTAPAVTAPAVTAPAVTASAATVPAASTPGDPAAVSRHPEASAAVLPVPMTPIAMSPVTPASQAPPAPAPAPAPLAAQVVPTLFTLAGAKAGEHVLTITVAPDNLGPVTVRAHVTVDSVRMELYAPTDAGRDALRAILPDLRRDLAGSGLNANLDLSSENNAPGQDPQRQKAPDARPRHTDHDVVANPDSGPRLHRVSYASTIDVLV